MLSVALGLLVAVASATLLNWTTGAGGDRHENAGSSPALTGPVPGEPVLRGVASAVDGDTLAFGPVRVRLFGIDAPEAQQLCQRDGRPYPCGQIAKAELQRLLEGAAVTCLPVALDQFRRIVARCSRHDSLDVAEELVERGWALAFRRFSDAYIAAEERARLRRRGIWAGDFLEPEAFRARR